MSVDARIRTGLAMIDEKLPLVDTLDRYDELGARVRKQDRRRNAAMVIAAVAAVAVSAVVVETRFGDDLAAPPATPSVEWVPSSEWVLVTSILVGTDYTPPVGDEWSKSLGKSETKTYPYWASVDPATRRFLITTGEATGLAVMSPGRVEPLFKFDDKPDGTGGLGAALGPGPEEVTMVSGDFHLVVVGPDGVVRRDLGPAGPELGNGLAWAPDGNTLAEANSEHTADSGTLTVALRSPDSVERTIVYEYTEEAPPWYDAEEHRFADGPDGFNSWWAPRLSDMHWAPDSTRLAFITTITPEGGDDGERHVQWQLFIADKTTGDVEQIADLGQCDEPVGEDGHHGGLCDRRGFVPSLSWTPDGKNLTVLADSTLTTYDLTGEELRSEPTDLLGPIVWMTRR